MKEKLKLMTILGTRPEIIRLSEVIKKCDKCFEHILVHTGQNYDYELNDIFFKELDLRKPNYYLNCAGENLGQTIGNIIDKSYQIIQKENPDAILILGDTNSALSAISAKRLKVPIFHMEAGNRCWDFNVAEMTNRVIVDHISDVNLAYVENSKLNLMNEGIDIKNIFVTGSPMYEVLQKNMQKIKNSQVLQRLNLKPREYILVSAHREENIDIDENFMLLANSINAVAKKYDIPIIYSTHPRTMKKINKTNFKFDELVNNVKPFGFIDYTNLEMNALFVLSDSGTLTEESSMLNFNGILFRTSTERPEGLDDGTIIISGIDKNSVLSACQLALEIGNDGKPNQNYSMNNVSDKVVKIIQSYTNIINKTVWHKK